MKVRQITVLVLALALVALALFACGGDTEVTQTNGSRSREERAERKEKSADDGIAIQGLMGSIPQEKVNSALEGRFPRFLGCFQEGYGRVRYLGGSFAMAFRIDVEGSVMWVYPKASTVGDLATEDCLLDVARSTRFAKPSGGEAEFSWSFEVDPPEDIRPPIPWDAVQLEAAVSEQLETLAECGSMPMDVTVYIDKKGQVIAAGGAVTSADDLEKRSCVVEQIAQWKMPKPGSYAAKGVFQIQ